MSKKEKALNITERFWGGYLYCHPSVLVKSHCSILYLGAPGETSRQALSLPLGSQSKQPMLQGRFGAFLLGVTKHHERDHTK